MTATDLATQPKPLADRVREHLRESIGDLFSEADLSEMVDTEIRKSLLEQREVRRQGYGGQIDIKPPLLHELLLEQMQPLVRDEITKWLTHHPQQIEDAISKAVREGITAIVLTVLDDKLSTAMANLRHEITNGLRQ